MMGLLRLLLRAVMEYYVWNIIMYVICTCTYYICNIHVHMHMKDDITLVLR